MMTEEETVRCLSYLPLGRSAAEWLAACALVQPGTSHPFHGLGRAECLLDQCAKWGVDPRDERLSVVETENWAEPPEGAKRTAMIGRNTAVRFKCRTYWLILGLGRFPQSLRLGSKGLDTKKLG